MEPPDKKPPPSDAPSGQVPETTMDLLKALENAAIVIEPPAPPVPEPEPEPSFNPYDRAPANKPTGRRS
jgi:hypothetical protein